MSAFHDRCSIAHIFDLPAMRVYDVHKDDIPLFAFLRSQPIYTDLEPESLLMKRMRLWIKIVSSQLHAEGKFWIDVEKKLEVNGVFVYLHTICTQSDDNLYLHSH